MWNVLWVRSLLPCLNTVKMNSGVMRMLPYEPHCAPNMHRKRLSSKYTSHTDYWTKNRKRCPAKIT